MLGWHNVNEVKKANRMSICDTGGLGKYLKIKSELEMQNCLNFSISKVSIFEIQNFILFFNKICGFLYNT